MIVLTNNVIKVYQFKITNKATNIISYVNDISSVSEEVYTIEEFDVANELWLDGKACGSIDQANRWLEAGYQTEPYIVSLGFGADIENLKAGAMQFRGAFKPWENTYSPRDLCAKPDGWYYIEPDSLSVLSLDATKGLTNGKVYKTTVNDNIYLKLEDFNGMTAMCTLTKTEPSPMSGVEWSYSIQSYLYSPEIEGIQAWNYDYHRPVWYDGSAWIYADGTLV